MSAHKDRAAVVIGDASPSRWLVIRHGEAPRVDIVKSPSLRVGAALDNDVVLRGPGVAPAHCTLRREGSTVRLYDRGSAGGTLLNGRQVLQPTAIDEAAQLLIGGHFLTIRWLNRPIDTDPLQQGYLPRDRSTGYSPTPSPAVHTRSAPRRTVHVRLLVLLGLMSCAAWLSYGLATNALAEPAPAHQPSLTTQGPDTYLGDLGDRNAQLGDRNAQLGDRNAQLGRDPRPQTTRAPAHVEGEASEHRARGLAQRSPYLQSSSSPGSSLAERLCRDPLEVPSGSRSVGSVTLGALDEPIQMPSLDLYKLRCPARAYSTEATANGLIQALACFRANNHYSGEIVIGDISGRDGGRLGPHLSHQSGRDVDLWLPIAGGAYGRGCTNCNTEYCRPEPEQVDWTATWALIDTLAGVAEIETIFLDFELQGALRHAALEAGANPALLDARIQWPRRGAPALVQHADGHVHHMHIRFRCPANDDSCVARPSPRRRSADA